MSQLFAHFIRTALVLVLVAGVASAQDATITGSVTDAETGDPIPGAHVVVLDIDAGTVTGADGTYTIANIPPRAQAYRVRASIVGFSPQTREVTLSAGQVATLNFAIAPGIELETVVVEGYRVRRVPIESGAISLVQGADIEGLTVRAPDHALQGRASGVRVTSRSGQPGAGVEIQIRGAGSINAGTDPLFIVDGVQMSRAGISYLAFTNPLNAIAPEDIESIEILKDAAATSIYGAQAANGVVIITTRRGMAGATEVTFESQLGQVGPISDFRVQNAEEYTAYRVQAFLNREQVRLGYGGANHDSWAPGNEAFDFAMRCAMGRELPGEPPLPGTCPRFGDPDTMGVGTNWQDLVFRQTLTQSYNLSFRGGDERTRFFTSGRYVNDNGQVIASNFQQYAGRVNLDHQVTDRLNLDARVGIANSRYRGTISDGPFINSPFFAAQFIPPTVPAFINNDPAQGFNLEPNPTFDMNPLAQEEWDIRTSSVVNLVASGAVNWELIPDIFSRTFFGIQFDDSDEYQFRDPRQPAWENQGGIGWTYNRRHGDFNVSQSLSYSVLLADLHRVSSMAGLEYKRGTQKWAIARKEQFPFHWMNALSAAANPVAIDEASTEYRQMSFFGDAEYTFDNTYQLRGVLRYDGNSRFGEDNRWGLFGTVGGYVRPFQTGFLPEVDFFDEFRLRASYGVTGNSLIGNFDSRRLFLGAGDYVGMPGIRPTQLGNNLLTWESSIEGNLGLDLGFLNNRVLTSINLYQQIRDDLLLERNLPNDSGFTSMMQNVGAIRARGVEFDLNTVNLDMGGFRWTTNFNITFQNMEVTRLVDDAEEVVFGSIVYRIGEAPRQYRMQRYAGVNPATGRIMHWTHDGHLTYHPTDDDLVLVGSPDPDFFGGFGNAFSYAGLTLDAFFQFDFGRQTFHNDRWFSDYSDWKFNKAQRMNEYWQQPGDMAHNPVPWHTGTYFDGSTEGEFLSSRWMEDASYIRLKQLRLSYALPSTLIAPAGMRTATLFVQGENLLTWTAFTGIDPEVVGTALGRFPQSRAFTTGVRVGI